EHRALARALLTGKPKSDRIYAIVGQDKQIQWKNPSLKGPATLLWTFPGQGTQSPGMGQSLAQNNPIFRQHWQRLATLIQKSAGWDLTQIINDQSPTSKLHQTEFAQPAIFCCSLALAYTLRDLQLEPEVLIGHSIGEIAAATYAGLWSEETACAIIVKRGQLMAQMPHGGMSAVAIDALNLRSILHKDLDIAAINTSQSCVIAGPLDALSEQEREFTARSLKFTRLRTSHAFHSRSMDAIVKPFRDFVGQFRTQALSKNIYSTKTGQLLSQSQASDPLFWAEHLRDPVLFHDALLSLSQQNASILALEVGSGSVSSTLCKRGLPHIEVRAVPILDQAHSEWPSYLQAIGELWVHGFSFDRSAALDLTQQQPLWKPGYPFARKRYFVEIDKTKNTAHQNSINHIQERSITMSVQKEQRWEAICKEVIVALEEASGLESLRDKLQISFFDLGLDSLFLTQASLTVGERLGLRISFRQMSEDLTSIQAIVDYAVRELPSDRFNPSVPPAAPLAPASVALSYQAPEPPARLVSAALGVPMTTASNSFPAGANQQLEQLFNQQLDIMRMQMQVLTNQTHQPLSTPQSASAVKIDTQSALPIAQPSLMAVSTPGPSAQDLDAPPPKQAFGAIARISTDRLSAEEKQNTTVQSFTKGYNGKTRKSKDFAAKNRGWMADPRVVTGFRPNFKELVYPLVTDRSSGPYLWDIDGNQYIDMLNGFGSNFFGHAPDFIKDILHKQIDAGYEIGPQFHLVGEASEMAASMTGHDRVAWCNTGSEAVLGCIRIARTVTGKKKIVSFLGSYHGINDEVIVRSNAKQKPYPAAPGILPNSVENMLVLDYGTEQSLAIIEKEINNLAAVLVEPVQSRRPEFVPVEFWRRLRQITERAGVPLIFDEVITGFRYHPGGIQRAFNIQADLISYGKVVGGGLPIGMIGGKKRFMDALDGGAWRFGDESVPEIGVTYFAGTFVRHPLAIAAAFASLKQIQKTGGTLQEQTNARADRLCKELNQVFEQMLVPYHYCNLGSLMKLKTTD
ncbi:MAG: aminotransferase class III-fold pyridoxal phosphate-dependent enzyme, partial [Proteobacteria bacterium]|nr:aminotransferase class III-fold pyridoxal phosphate-dependent enzyme [Pseudomonadota bacterium]